MLQNEERKKTKLLTTLSLAMALMQELALLQKQR